MPINKKRNATVLINQQERGPVGLNSVSPRARAEPVDDSFLLLFPPSSADQLMPKETRNAKHGDHFPRNPARNPFYATLKGLVASSWTGYSEGLEPSRSDGFKMHLHYWRLVRVKAIEKFEPLLEALSIQVDTNRSD
ncbi:hypothetical protein KQX54_020706 [Cotesia glomerata]|uniref:Uncharacterized protein n=1 Tax=Cotesia glomerata TaxID=32391 RepID=A0AAV7I1C9_COTGL|nr:hypothetical protein KQX54_020706 [Cotesia glomerata]